MNRRLSANVTQLFRLWLLVVWICHASWNVQGADTVDVTPLVNANNQFAFDLMRQVIQSEPDGNIFLAPYNAATVLQIAGTGAAGQTKTELLQDLHTAGQANDVLNPMFLPLYNMVQSNPAMTLKLANGIWVDQGFAFNPSFADENRRLFQAQLTVVDFTRPASAQIINDWANRQTGGKIPEAVEFPFAADTQMILATAIYFKDTWGNPFDKKLTHPGDFHLPGEKIKTIPMMRQDGHRLEYAETADYQAVRLSLSGGVHMEVFLPTAGHDPKSVFCAIGTCEHWAHHIQPAFHLCPVILELPKFKVEYSARLNAPLQALGLKLAFESKADFSGITDKPLRISEVKQKSFVEVNEAGAEAAGVTAVNSSMGILEHHPDAVQMIVNRPFIFIIEDDNARLILFIGMITHPDAPDPAAL